MSLKKLAIVVILIITTLLILTTLHFNKKAPKEPQKEKSIGEVLKEQRAQSLKRQREKYQTKPSDEKALRRWGM